MATEKKLVLGPLARSFTLSQWGIKITRGIPFTVTDENCLKDPTVEKAIAAGHIKILEVEILQNLKKAQVKNPSIPPPLEFPEGASEEEIKAVINSATTTSQIIDWYNSEYELEPKELARFSKLGLEKMKAEAIKIIFED